MWRVTPASGGLCQLLVDAHPERIGRLALTNWITQCGNDSRIADDLATLLRQIAVTDLTDVATRLPRFIKPARWCGVWVTAASPRAWAASATRRRRWPPPWLDYPGWVPPADHLTVL